MARRHQCPDWDYMVIEPKDPEFECCTCYEDEMEKKTALQKARSALKKAEHVNTPLSIKRKLKKEKKS